MPCKKSQSGASPFGASGTGPYATEAECLNACQEGACCDRTYPEYPFCYVAPQCVCLEAGHAFLGKGTTCAAGICLVGACCKPDGTCLDGITESACVSQGGTFHIGKTCAEKPCCCITPPQPALDDCDGFNYFWAQCTSFCDECTCESPNGEQRYNSCFTGLEAVLQQQGYEAVHYDEYAVTGPAECNTGTYLYGRDVLACCNGEVSFFTADEAVWKPAGSAWEQAPCLISCNINNGGRLRENGDLVISKCINPLP